MQCALSRVSHRSKFIDASFERGEFSLVFGNENRGASITINFDEDKEIGGMTLRIIASGY